MVSYVSAATLEVTQPKYVTDNNDYDRNPSIIYDGSDYWLFYTKGDTCSARDDPCDADSDNYTVYYKTASNIGNLNSASETKLSLSETARPAGFDQRDVSAAKVGSDIYVFVSSGFGGGSTDHSFYYYKYSGGVWTGPISFSGVTYGAHINVVSDGGNNIYLVYDNGKSMFLKSSDKGSSWSAPYEISNDNMPKIEIDGSGNLYVVSIEDGTGNIEVYKSTDSGSSWSNTGTAISGAGLYDPTILIHDGSLYVVTAPYVGVDDRQYLIFTKSTDGLTGSSWTTQKQITNGGYGSTYWWDYWPEMISDGSDLYIFYTTERDGTSLGDGEIAYYKLDWNMNNDHYDFIQPAIDAASDGDLININEGTYNPLTIEGFNGLTIQSSGVGTVTITGTQTVLDP